MLFVCTGNICRSPMAARLLQARLAPGQRATVRSVSAGLAALAGYPMDPLAADVLRQFGGDPEGHVAQQLTPGLVRTADLVLAASTEHRSRIVRDDPAVMRRGFTLREFARLGGELEPPGGGTSRSARVRAVAAQRGVVDPVEDPAHDDIGDPFGAPADVMAACGELISEAVDAVLRILALDQDG